MDTNGNIFSYVCEVPKVLECHFSFSFSTTILIVYECFMVSWMHAYRFVCVWMQKYMDICIYKVICGKGPRLCGYPHHFLPFIYLLIDWLIYLFSYLFWEYLSKPIDSWLQLSWLALEIQVSTYPCNPSTKITIAHHCTQLFMFMLVSESTWVDFLHLDFFIVPNLTNQTFFTPSFLQL